MNGMQSFECEEEGRLRVLEEEAMKVPGLEMRIEELLAIIGGMKNEQG